MRAKSLRGLVALRAAVEALEDRRLLSAEPVITEFMASNNTGIVDDNGTAKEDWVEIYNPDTAAKDLGGYYLTDRSDLLTEWQFQPGTVVQPGKYLLVWASNKDRRDPAHALHTNFALGKSGEYLGLVKPDGTTVVSQYAPTFPVQTDDISYGIVGTNNFVNPTLAYFSTPTPGAANSGAITVSDVTFSKDRGFYDSSFSLTLSTPTVSASIRYTTDGSAPTSTSGILYTVPISVTTTTNIRAVAYKTGAGTSKVATESYIFLNDVLHQPATVPGFPNDMKDVNGGFVPQDMAMDPAIVNSSTYSGVMKQAMTSIPSLIITAPTTDMFGANGFYDGETEHAASIELIDPAHPENNDQINGAAEPHSHNRLKRSLMISFKPEYGPSSWKTSLLEDGPVGGDSAKKTLDDLVLRGGNNRAWTRLSNPNTTTFTEDEWYRQSQIAMDGFGSHGTFVHLYLNGVYWGLYNVAERPDENWQETYFGGDQADYFSTNHDGRTRGDSTAWDDLRDLIATKNQNLAAAADYQTATQLLDVSEYSDYLILNWFQAQTDWPKNNWFVGNKNGADGTPIKYFAWDGEWSWDSAVDGANVNGAWVHPAFRTTSTDQSDDATIWRALRANPDFMTLFADRVYKAIANDGALTDANSIARFDALNAYVKDAVVAESARWGDSLSTLGYATRTRDNQWQAEVNKIRAIMQGNDARLLTALRGQGYYPSINPATFNQRGGPVPSGFDVVLTNPNGVGTIYYTTDGSDPRLPGGGISSAAKIYSGAIRMLASKNVNLRIKNGSTWSAMDGAAFSVSAFSKLRITELMYNPAAPPAPETTDGDEFEYVELKNTGDSVLNLNGVKLGGGIDFTFGDVNLTPGQYIVVVEDATAFAARYGNGINVAGQYDGKLADEGEALTLADKDGNKILDFTYSPTWFPTRTETQGYSLVIIDPLAAPTTWDSKSNWRPSGANGGSPGAVDVQPSNSAPTVTASGPTSITLPATTDINAVLSDDGLPFDGTLTVKWTKFSGPGTVTFGNSNVASTTAGFSIAGTYVLRATANDGELSGVGDVTILVNPAPSNQAPTVIASGPTSITLPAAASISAAISDDGLPLNSTTTVKWTKFSGPGTVTFGNSTAASTTAGFSVAGTYVLRATASDGSLSGFGDVTIVVNPGPVTNAVTSFTLVDSTTDLDLFDIHEGDTINVALLPHKTVNVRANPASATVASVKFSWDSTSGSINSSYRTDSSRPFALFGDSSGNYSNGTFNKGKHTLKATPYTKTSASGTAGTSLTVHFTVIDVPTPTPPIAPGSFTAVAASTTSIKLAWTDLSSNETGFEIEKSLNGTDFTPVTITAAGVKTYTAPGLTADTQYWFHIRSVNSVGNSAWIKVGPVRTPPVNTSVPAVTGLILVNADSDTDVLQLTDGMTITASMFAALKNFNVRADANALTQSVKFGYQSTSSYKTENTAPFSLFGDDAGNYKGVTFKAGTYTIAATGYSSSNATGTKGATLTVTFKVV